MLTSLVSLYQGNVKKFKKLMKIVNIDEESQYLLNDSRYFDKIFRKYVAYDNIKSSKKAWLHPLSRRHIFGKTTGGVN